MSATNAPADVSGSDERMSDDADGLLHDAADGVPAVSGSGRLFHEPAAMPDRAADAVLSAEGEQLRADDVLLLADADLPDGSALMT
jgi:hypothetical protein